MRAMQQVVFPLHSDPDAVLFVSYAEKSKKSRVFASETRDFVFV